MDDARSLTLVGDHPVLDLVNTVERGIPAPGTVAGDALTGAADVLTWAVRVGVLDLAEADVSLPASLTPIRALRAALWTIVLAVERNPKRLDPMMHDLSGEQ